MAIHISKLDAAKRQLDTAITLFFHSGDIISIHTLSGASYNLLKGLCDKNGITNYMVKNESWIREDKRKEFRGKINEAENFFKHADRDQESLLKFNPEITELFLWDATHMYSQLTTEHPPLFMLFRMWMSCKYPDTILMSYPGDQAQKNSAIQSMQDLKLDPSNREKFMEFLPLIIKATSTLQNGTGFNK